MCNLMKVQSSFLLKGHCYKAQFSKQNSNIVPVVKKLVVSICGVKIWKTQATSVSLTADEALRLRKSSTMKAIKFLKNTAQTVMSTNNVN